LKKNKNKYSSPKIKNLGNAKTIIKSVFVNGSGDSFPATTEVLASG
tara:strand:+ start:1154 stop:1291 length:138 start_codon:yes stop_codon:yes gene_type:complete